MKFLINDKSLNKTEKIEIGISYFFQLTLVAVILYSIYKNDWLNTFLVSGIFILGSLPTILRKSYKVRLPVEIDLTVILFVYATLFLGGIQSFYLKYWWWDGLMHTLSGVLFGIAGFLLVYVLNEEGKTFHLTPFFVVLFSFAFANMIGAVWEIFEFAMDSFFGFNWQETGLVDTMWDLIVTVIGSASVGILGYIYMRKERHFVDNIIHRFLGWKPLRRLKKYTVKN